MAAEYPVLCKLSKPYAIAVTVHYVTPPYPGGVCLLNAPKLESVILDAEEGSILKRFAVDDCWRLRMRRDGNGVELIAHLDEDENADDLYAKISKALEPYGYRLV